MTINTRYLAWLILFYASLSNPVLAEPELLDLSLEELMQVKLTAQKREQSWFEIPLSVDVYDGRQLRENNIHQLRELAQAAPGLIYGRIGSTLNLYIRGIGSDLLSIAADSSTAVYMDDVYLARPEMALMHFWDTDRVELLKGPQGALYGRNATSGAINVIRNRANFEQTDGYARINAGSFNNRQLEAAIGGPINDSLAVRASVFAISDDGYTQDLDPAGGTHIDNTQVGAGRVELRWRLGERWETSLTAMRYRNNNDGPSVKPSDDKGLAQALGARPIVDLHQVANNLTSYSNFDSKNLNWHWQWRGERSEFLSISALHSLDTSYHYNTDGTEIAVSEAQIALRLDQRSQEFRWLSTADSDWQWLVGATWLEETPELDLGLIRHLQATSTVIDAYAKTKAWGVYGELSWRFKPAWQLKLGLRNTNESRDGGNQLWSTHDLSGLDSTRQQATAIGNSRHNDNFEHLSPQLVLSYTPTLKDAQGLWYLSATEGYKSGGANSLTTGPAFDPEEVLSIESGYKVSHKHYQWQLALFNYDYRDLQVVSYEKGITAITNATSASIHGLDAQLRKTLTPHWSWQVGATLLNAHYDRFITSEAGAARDVSGNPMPYAPDWDLNQSLNYQVPIAQGNVSASVQHHYQSKTYFNQFADEDVATAAQHIFNLNVLWRIDTQWSLGASIYNLTDRDYFQNIARFSTTSLPSEPAGNAMGVAAPGRQWLINLNYQY